MGFAEVTDGSYDKVADDICLDDDLLKTYSKANGGINI